MSRQWWPTNLNDIFSERLLHFVLVLNALVRKSSNLLEFNQTHNAAMFSSKCEIFALQIRHIYARAYARGVAVTPLLWAWYFTKKFLSAQRILTVFAYILLVNLSSYWNITELICVQISRNIVNGPKSDN